MTILLEEIAQSEKQLKSFYFWKSQNWDDMEKVEIGENFATCQRDKKTKFEMEVLCLSYVLYKSQYSRKT